MICGRRNNTGNCSSERRPLSFAGGETSKFLVVCSYPIGFLGGGASDWSAAPCGGAILKLPPETCGPLSRGRGATAQNGSTVFLYLYLHFTVCSTCAEAVLNLAGSHAQFARWQCSIWRGILSESHSGCPSFAGSLIGLRQSWRGLLRQALFCLRLFLSQLCGAAIKKRTHAMSALYCSSARQAKKFQKNA